jgi:uncharacterized phage protein gp47/JayE
MVNMSVFLKSFDDLLENILTDYQNLDPAPDITQGSITYIKGACLASMLWGLYKYQDYLANQIFPDVCDTNNLNHHGAVLGIARSADDTDETYRTKILNYLRQPPAGGNKLDYETWAGETPGVTGAGFTGIVTVASAVVQTPADGLTPGNVAVTLMPTNEAVIGLTGMQDLVDNCYDYIDARRPVTANQLTVQQATPFYAYIELTVTPPTGQVADLQLMTDDVTAFIANLKPGDPCYKSKLQAICIQDGAENVVVNYPTSDIVPSATQVLRSSGVSIHF